MFFLRFALFRRERTREKGRLQYYFRGESDVLWRVYDS